MFLSQLIQSLYSRNGKMILSENISNIAYSWTHTSSFLIPGHKKMALKSPKMAVMNINQDFLFVFFLFFFLSSFQSFVFSRHACPHCITCVPRFSFSFSCLQNSLSASSQCPTCDTELTLKLKLIQQFNISSAVLFVLQIWNTYSLTYSVFFFFLTFLSSSKCSGFSSVLDHFFFCEPLTDVHWPLSYWHVCNGLHYMKIFILSHLLFYGTQPQHIPFILLCASLFLVFISFLEVFFFFIV